MCTTFSTESAREATVITGIYIACFWSLDYSFGFIPGDLQGLASLTLKGVLQTAENSIFQELATFQLDLVWTQSDCHFPSTQIRALKLASLAATQESSLILSRSRNWNLLVISNRQPLYSMTYKQTQQLNPLDQISCP